MEGSSPQTEHEELVQSAFLLLLGGLMATLACFSPSAFPSEAETEGPRPLCWKVASWLVSKYGPGMWGRRQGRGWEQGRRCPSWEGGWAYVASFIPGFGYWDSGHLICVTSWSAKCSRLCLKQSSFFLPTSCLLPSESTEPDSWPQAYMEPPVSPSAGWPLGTMQKRGCGTLGSERVSCSNGRFEPKVY